jgi:glycosyltransferase involved in cell wall biosynthesis
MRFSILTPSYNQSCFLERNIQSVANQDIADVEHIVIDGGSSDGTREILSRYGERVRWVSERDNGQADALNKGFSWATGDIVGWLNVDEYYEPQIFGRVSEAFRKSPEVVLVYGDFRRVKADGVAIRVNRQWRFDHSVCQVQTPIIQNCAAFFRRNRLIECGGFDASWNYLLDWELYVRFMKGNQRWVKLDAIVGNFTMHAQSKTATARIGFDREIERLRQREFPGWSPRQIERHRRKQEWRMRYHMLLDGVIAEKIWFKLVRQAKYNDIFAMRNNDIPLLSPFLRWITGENRRT